MASMAVKYWRTVTTRSASTRQFSTAATTPRMKPVAPEVADLADHHVHQGSAKRWWAKGEFVPIYVVLGLVAVALSFAGHTAKQQLVNSPSVRVSKKKREMVPEVEDPGRVARESDRFINKSILRRVAHIQDFDAVRSGISDPTRPNDPFRMPRNVEDLRTVGVDPGAH